MQKQQPAIIPPQQLVEDVQLLITQAKYQFIRQVNALSITLYWSIGKRISEELLLDKRAEYGKKVVEYLAERIAATQGRGYSKRNLWRMVQFARCYPDKEIVSSLMTQLDWTHFIYLLTIEDELKRNFYAEMCRIEGWDTRTLISKIGSMYYERTALAKKPIDVIQAEVKKLRETSQVNPDVVFQDPIILQSLSGLELKTEQNLEQAILDDIESFLLDLGSGFAFLERQKSLEIDGEFYRIDLLMYHRRLRATVVIELKMGKFKAQDKGQLELYLRWLERYDMQPGENPPIGIVLCSEKSDETVELLKLEKSGIKVCQFLTELPPKDVLAARLHAAIERARSQQERQKLLDGDIPTDSKKRE